MNIASFQRRSCKDIGIEIVLRRAFVYASKVIRELDLLSHEAKFLKNSTGSTAFVSMHNTRMHIVVLLQN